MRLKQIELKNFKRFTHLVIDDIPASARLVLLIGANGSGKSSVFDAFELASSNDNFFNSDFNSYYKKDEKESYHISIKGHKEDVYLQVGGSERKTRNIVPNNFYGRSSFRQVSQLKRLHVGGVGSTINNNDDRPKLFIDRDQRFENDIDYIMESILNDVFQSKLSGVEVIEKYVGPINKAFRNIFGEDSVTGLELSEFLPPSGEKPLQVFFKKGQSKVHYDFLSAGEKEVFNILINLLNRTKFYPDTVYFIDELDLHLNTKLQYNLLKEITENWIPDHCQLWTASHSLGFIDYANESEQAVILDLDNLDFDQSQIIKPSEKNNYQVFELAVSREFIDRVFQDKTIVFTENTDTPLFNNLSLPGYFFFVAIDKMDAFQKARNLGYKGLIDRDYLSDNDITELKQVYPFLSILPYYSIENILYHPDNLEEYFLSIKKDFDKDHYIKELTNAKNEAKDSIVLGLNKARDGYPFYKENENIVKLKGFKDQGRSILELISSNDFETFYKVFPMKDYAKNISYRQNLPSKNLANTKWFITQIKNILK